VRSTPDWRVNDLAPRLSFFFAAYTDLFEEIAKFRAARRLWYRLMKEKFNASDAAARLPLPYADRWRYAHGATAAQQRGTGRDSGDGRRAGGTQCFHTNSYDEALALPTERQRDIGAPNPAAARHENGRAGRGRSAGGSWYVEGLTDKIEAAARALVEEVEVGGGSVKAIERGFFQEAIARSAYEQQRDIEAGEQIVVGVNGVRHRRAAPPIPAPDYSTLPRHSGSAWPNYGKKGTGRWSSVLRCSGGRRTRVRRPIDGADSRRRARARDAGRDQ